MKIESKFKLQNSIDVHGIKIFEHNVILDFSVGYISYAYDMHETAIVLKGVDGLGTMYLIVNGDKRTEVEEVIAKYSDDKWLKDGMFGEIVAWACQHPDLNIERSTMGRLNSACGFKKIKPINV